MALRADIEQLRHNRGPFVDVVIDPLSASTRAVVEATSRAFAHFGIAPGHRDRMLADVARSERRAAGALLRWERKSAIEMAVAGQALDHFEFDDGPSEVARRAHEVVREHRLAGASEERVRDAAFALVLKRTPPATIACGPLAWHEALEGTCRAMVFDHLSTLCRVGAPPSSTVLEGATWDALAGYPRRWRREQSEWLGVWSREAPVSDLLGVETRYRVRESVYATGVLPMDRRVTILSRATLALLVAMDEWARNRMGGYPDLWSVVTRTQLLLEHEQAGMRGAGSPAEVFEPYRTSADVILDIEETVKSEGRLDVAFRADEALLATLREGRVNEPEG